MFIEKDDIDWLKYSHETNVKRKIREKSDYQESLDDYFAGNLYAKGSALPWDKARHISIRLHRLFSIQAIYLQVFLHQHLRKEPTHSFILQIAVYRCICFFNVLLALVVKP